MNGMPSSAQISLRAGGLEGQLARLDDAGPGDQEQRLVDTDVESAEFHGRGLS
jgi:hypothetical protein